MNFYLFSPIFLSKKAKKKYFLAKRASPILEFVFHIFFPCEIHFLKIFTLFFPHFYYFLSKKFEKKNYFWEISCINWWIPIPDIFPMWNKNFKNIFTIFWYFLLFFPIFPYFSDKKIKINIFWAEIFFFFFPWVHIIIIKRFSKKNGIKNSFFIKKWHYVSSSMGDVSSRHFQNGPKCSLRGGCCPQWAGSTTRPGTLQRVPPLACRPPMPP